MFYNSRNIELRTSFAGFEQSSGSKTLFVQNKNKTIMIVYTPKTLHF